MAEAPEELKKNVAELVELSKQIKTIKSDLKVLTDREKELKKSVCHIMEEKKIDTINLRKGKVSHKKSQKKPSFTKKTVQAGLGVYFQGDEAKVEGAITCICDITEPVETSSVSLTGLHKD